MNTYSVDNRFSSKEDEHFKAKKYRRSLLLGEMDGV